MLLYFIAWFQLRCECLHVRRCITITGCHTATLVCRLDTWWGAVPYFRNWAWDSRSLNGIRNRGAPLHGRIDVFTFAGRVLCHARTGAGSGHTGSHSLKGIEALIRPRFLKKKFLVYHETNNGRSRSWLLCQMEPEAYKNIDFKTKYTSRNSDVATWTAPVVQKVGVLCVWHKT